MANIINQQKLIDSTRRAVIKYVGTVDTNTANAVLLNVSGLAYSLNANGKILSSGTDTKSAYRTQIKRIWGQGHFKGGGFVTLNWGSVTNTNIVTFGAGQFDYNFDSEGLSAAIPSSSNGDLLITTTGVISGDAFTVFVDLKKDGRDFDQGQTARPADFNQGAFGQ